MPSSAQRPPLPRGGSLRSAQGGSFLNPFFSFSARKKRTVSIFQEKKEGLAKSGVHPAPPSCDNSLNWLYLPALTHLSAGNYAPHAILMMAVISLPTNTVKAKTSIRRKSRARLWSMESPENHPKGSLVVSFFSSRCDTVLFFLRIEKEKNGVAKPRSLYIFRRVCYNKTSF